MNLKSWVTAARPRTLSLSATPVMVGAALAWAAEGKIDAAVVLAALLGAMLIQIGANLHNDAADSERGGDGPDRIGPPRVTASGLIAAGAVKRGAAASFAAAGLLGLYLVLVGGWPILALGALSILSGWAYTGGPAPIAYTPMGELFVIAFFGVGAVGGVYWLCAADLGLPPLAAGLALGLMAAAVLLVNNCRDVEADARVGRRTLAIVAGRRVAPWIYAGLMLLPFALLPAIGGGLPRGRVWPALGALPLALLLARRVIRQPRGGGLNRVLVFTAQTQLVFAILLAAGLVL